MSAATPRLPRAVFVHGAGGGGWEWNIWVRVFAAFGWRCEAPDLQPAAAGLQATRFADYQDQLRGWLAADAASTVLIGASLGGLLTLRCADLAAALILVNPLPPRPWQSVPPRVWPDVVPWRSARSLPGTRAAMADADDAACLYAFRHWRDESGQVLNEACAGIEVDPPRLPCLVLASTADIDVPASTSAALAQAYSASLLRMPGDHLAPLLGRSAAAAAQQAVGWLNAIRGFTAD